MKKVEFCKSFLSRM